MRHPFERRNPCHRYRRLAESGRLAKITPQLQHRRYPSRALGWLGDWANHDQPFAYVATQPLEQLPLDMPRIFDARRAADAMSSEFFEERV